MEYFKLFLRWLGFITMLSLFGEYIISDNVNGFIQLICFFVLVWILVYLSDETIDIFKNKENDDKLFYSFLAFPLIGHIYYVLEYSINATDEAIDKIQNIFKKNI